jgi:hypothetical protein
MQKVVFPDPGAPMTMTGPPLVAISSAAPLHSPGMLNVDLDMQLFD